MKAIGRGIGRFFATLGITLLWLIVLLVLIIVMITHGPSVQARNMFVTTLLETGNVKWLVSIFLSEKEIQEAIDSNKMIPFDADTKEDLINVDTDLDPSVITIEHIEGNGFSAVMMIVNDPSRVFVGTTYENGQWGEYGLELDKIVQKYNATGGMNAGLYAADMNKGGHPYGPVVSNGEIQNLELGLDYEGLVLIAMSEDNIFKVIDINGKGADEVRKIIADEKIRDAVVFQEDASDTNNHFVKLIINGERRELNGMGSGWNPRTAIGQTADGRMLLLTTDGRGIKNHIGANASDLIDIMYKYGAVNAANLDGGSSSCMFYNGEWLQNSVTFGYVNTSWRLPTTFLVR